MRHSTNSFNSELPLIIKSGDEISYNWGANPSEFNVYGILIDDVIEPIQIDLLNSNYTVPNGKNLYIISINSFGGSTTYFTVNGLRHSTNSFNSHLPLIIKSGDEISYNWGANPSEFNVYGYLADENYFVGCGGGGSSSTSSLDSTAIANMIAAAGGGCTSFGNSTNVINLNWNPLTSSSYFEEAQEDGFFGGQMNCGSSYAGSFLVWDDTTSSPVYSYAITNGVATFLIPIKKGQYWNVSGICIDVNFFIPLECGGGGSSTNNSSFGPTFIDPIEIHGNGGNDKNVCENSSQTSFMTGIQFNADSALNQAVSNVILNIEFLVTTAGLSYNCSTSSMEMSSWNGSVTTPIMDYHYQSTQGTQSSRTVISKQVLIPTNNGIIDINITGSGCCQPSQGQINIVGYY